MADIEIREARGHELPAAAAVLSRGMRDNPVHVQVFGPDADARQEQLERFYRIVLRWMSHPPWVGTHEEAIVAVWGMAGPGACQPALVQKLGMLPLIAFGCGVSATSRVLRWSAAWASRDPKEPHWHLGPVGVDAHLQGRGVGSRVMGAWCEFLDQRQAAGYLETDKPENVRFYGKFGFETVAEADVLGAPNWFMWRTAR